jgi:hypothetical protein
MMFRLVMVFLAALITDFVFALEPSSVAKFPAIGGYKPASDVRGHSRVSLDAKEINALLDGSPIDFAAIKAIYTKGKNSIISSEKGLRTLQSFTRDDRNEPTWNLYVANFGDKTWIDTYVSSAIDGTGVFEGAPPLVRRQGIQKGIVNQVLIAQMLHELDNALILAERGEFDPDSGAPHRWDEAWAYYHGANPDSAPFATANKRGSEFGRSTAVNDALLSEFEKGKEALLVKDAATAKAANAEIRRQLAITYVQATIRYAAKVDDALREGNLEQARIVQVEGWSYFRVIEPFVAQANPAAAAKIRGYYDLSGQPKPGAGAAVHAAIESAYSRLGIKAAEVGRISGS